MKKLLRFIVYLAGLAVLSLGVVLNTKTGLGVSAINSIPYAAAELTGLSLGMTTAILYMICVGIESIMMGKNWNVKILLQVPFSILFGIYVNVFNEWITYQAEGIVLKILLLAVAIVLTGLGAFLSVSMDIVPNAPDGLAQMMGEKLKKGFGFGKCVLDIVCVVLTCILCLAVRGNLIGIGIGTVASALLIGQVIRICGNVLKEPLAKSL
ncbi:MAG: hypothetical protein HFI40_03455 [Lachnospiraceae bacterium]|jgi:uncharacterized membrane protein YczE|nr:hypothetical protein [Lachnospiraceae bacterium]